VRKSYQSIFVLFCVILLASCASGHKINYNSSVANISATGGEKVAVAVHDQRPYIVSGETNPDYVGLNRGGVKLVPFKPQSIATESGNPLADDMAESICKSLAAKGFKASAVKTIAKEDKDKILARMKETKAERLLLLTLYEWQSDTYINTGLSYDAKLEIFDRAGNKLAEKALKGEDNIKRDDIMSPGLSIEQMKVTLPKLFENKIEALFNNKEVIEALK
jgi:hypothetical protein